MVNVTNVQKGCLDLGHHIATDFTRHVHRLFSFSYDRQKNTNIKCQLGLRTFSPWLWNRYLWTLKLYGWWDRSTVVHNVIMWNRQIKASRLLDNVNPSIPVSVSKKLFPSFEYSIDSICRPIYINTGDRLGSIHRKLGKVDTWIPLQQVTEYNLTEY